MPGTFDDVLKLISDEQERQAILKTLEKHPEAKKAIGHFEALAKDGVTFNEWNKTSGDENRRRYNAFPKLTEDLEAAQREISTLKAGKAPEKKDEEIDLENMTVSQLEERMLARFREQGFVTRGEAERMADEKATAAAAAAQGRVYTHGLPMVERMMAVQDKFRKDFGKEMDRAAFGKFIEDNKFADVDKAYEAFSRDDYVNKVKTDAFEQGRLAGSKETAEKLAKENNESALRGLPVDMQGSQGFTSRPGAAPEPVALKDIPEDYKLQSRGGISKLAWAVAAKIDADKAAGKSQP